MYAYYIICVCVCSTYSSHPHTNFGLFVDVLQGFRSCAMNQRPKLYIRKKKKNSTRRLWKRLGRIAVSNCYYFVILFHERGGVGCFIPPNNQGFSQARPRVQASLRLRRNATLVVIASAYWLLFSFSRLAPLSLSSPPRITVGVCATRVKGTHHTAPNFSTRRIVISRLPFW